MPYSTEMAQIIQHVEGIDLGVYLFEEWSFWLWLLGKKIFMLKVNKLPCLLQIEIASTANIDNIS